MKKYIWLMISMSMIIFVLSWCQQWKIDDQKIVTSQNFSQQDLTISDPQIKKEIDYLRDQKIISPETYAEWQKVSKKMILDSFDVMIDEKGNVRHSESYIIPPYNPLPIWKWTDPQYIERSFIQERMKENKNL